MRCHLLPYYVYVKVKIKIVLLTHYCAGDKIEKNEMSRDCSAYGERRGVYRVLVGKPEGKRPMGRPTRRWEENIKMDLQEVGCGAWIELDRNRDMWRELVNAVMTRWFP
jgi:hypothetical protein